VKRALPFLLPLFALGLAAALLSPSRGLADDRARPVLMNEDTRAAIERGLRFLARCQNDDGSWTSDAGHKVNEDYVVAPGGKDVHHVGVTALGILAFLAAGHVPGRGPYGLVVDRAVDFLLSRVDADGFIHADGTRMYSHAFATLALAEVYGMSRAPSLRRRLERAVELTISCQNKTGGWRYVPFTVDSDMSVTVCQVVALRAAMNVGIKVKQDTIDRALRYVVDSAITADGRSIDEEVGAFYYQPSNTRWNRSSFSLTAAGLTTLFQAGIYDDTALYRYMEQAGIKRDPPPQIEKTVDYMERSYPLVFQQHRRHYFYYYGNYYAAQAMYNVGGAEPDRWERWYDRVRDDLLSLEVRGTGPGGRGDESQWVSNVGDTGTFATAVAILILSMPFDYLPIHQK
jgi:hypothetical protein